MLTVIQSRFFGQRCRFCAAIRPTEQLDHILHRILQRSRTGHQPSSARKCSSPPQIPFVLVVSPPCGAGRCPTFPGPCQESGSARSGKLGAEGMVQHDRFACSRCDRPPRITSRYAVATCTKRRRSVDPVSRRSQDDEISTSVFGKRWSRGQGRLPWSYLLERGKLMANGSPRLTRRRSPRQAARPDFDEARSLSARLCLRPAEDASILPGTES